MNHYLEYCATDKQNVSCLAEVSLDVDADRDGVVEKNNPNKVRSDVFLDGTAKPDT